MCGIAGVSQLTDNTSVFAGLLGLMINNRGPQSWGITNGGAELSDRFRKLGPISTEWEPPSLEWMGKPFAIHTRAASVGGVSIRNQHPFLIQGEDRWVLGMQNGCVSNHAQLAKASGLDKYEVDTEVLFHFMANGLDLEEIRGWGALWWSEGDLGSLTPYGMYLVRFNMQDLHVNQLNSGEIAWASTREALTTAARYSPGVKLGKWITVNENRLYGVDITGGSHKLVDLDELKFGGRISQMGFASTPGRADYRVYTPPTPVQTPPIVSQEEPLEFPKSTTWKEISNTLRTNKAIPEGVYICPTDPELNAQWLEFCSNPEVKTYTPKLPMYKALTLNRAYRSLDNSCKVFTISEGDIIKPVDMYDWAAICIWSKLQDTTDCPLYTSVETSKTPKNSFPQPIESPARTPRNLIWRNPSSFVRNILEVSPFKITMYDHHHPVPETTWVYVKSTEEVEV